MTTEQFDIFLKQAGYAAEHEKNERGAYFSFKDRGYVFGAFAYDDSPELLHIVCRCGLPENLDQQRLDDAMRALEVEYPVVKLRELRSTDAVGYEVSAEQFEPDPSTVEKIFWATIDLLRAVSLELLSRLNPPPQVGQSTDTTEQWFAHLEQALRNGSHDIDQDPAAVPARIRASIALVILSDRSSGSAFCFKSTTDASFYVTNAHVVGDALDVTIYRQVPSFEKATGSVIARGVKESVDLAIISVPIGNVPAVTLSTQPLACDVPVGLAGYARVQMWAADVLGEVTPSIHLGTVTAVNKDRTAIMHDAVSRPGDSGGPLFDPATGYVIGIEKSGWQGEEAAFALGIPVLASFLRDHGLDFTVVAKDSASKLQGV